MKIVFIADAHLKGLDDPNQKTLVNFMGSLDGVDTLVILGDLFDFWAGDNRIARRNYLPLLESLASLKDKGVKIIYLEGNHDFSMGTFFTEKLGASVHPDSFALDVGGKRVFLSHGDTAAMTLGYRLWRGFLRSPVFRIVAFLATPGVVWKSAVYLSRRSRNQGKGSPSLDSALRDFARKKINEGFSAVVMAHSHVAGVHREGSGYYANPGPWADKLHYLVYDGKTFRLERWKAR